MGNSAMNNVSRTMDLPADSSNGLCLSGHYLPEELIITILSHVPIDDVLNCALVCKNWNTIIKSNTIWRQIFMRKHRNKKFKNLPWYVYYIFFKEGFFDRNFIRNGNGEDRYNHWTLIKNYGDGFAVEKRPEGSPLLPPDIEEFYGSNCCFATSYHECRKSQLFKLNNTEVYGQIMREFRPKIYASEWICGRFDCGCVYKLIIRIKSADENKEPHEHVVVERFEQGSDPQWKKVELFIDDYPDDIVSIEFIHEGKDLMFWKGWYGSKMAGGVLKILFDTIEPTS